MMDNNNILFQDEFLAVLSKPSGVVVNRAATHNQLTVQDYIEKSGMLKVTAAQEGSDEFISRSGIVHRLDKDTSGVLVVAKTVEVFYLLQSQFKERSVKKEYKAVVIGKVTQPLFEVDAPVGRNPKNRLSMAIIGEGKPAKTKFEVVKNLNLDNQEYTFLSCFPITGRTHQIRVHLAALNYPVVLDPIYCTRKQIEISSVTFNRMMLHALSIEFTHPITKEVIKVVSELPSDFLRFI